jgi:hypothetical protein
MEACNVHGSKSGQAISPSAQLALLALMGLCVLGVAVGHHTPISTVLLLVFTVSLHNSNLRWSGFSGQVPSLTSEAGYRP